MGLGASLVALAEMVVLDNFLALVLLAEKAEFV